MDVVTLQAAKTQGDRRYRKMASPDYPMLLLAQGDSRMQGFGKSPDGTTLGKGNTPTITPGSFAFYQRGIQSWITYLCLGSGGAILESYNGSYGGDQTTDMLTRLPTTLTKPGSHIMLGDARNDWAIGGLTFAQSWANLLAMIAQAQVAQVEPILATSLPDTQQLATFTGTLGTNTGTLSSTTPPGFGAGVVLAIDTGTHLEQLTVLSSTLVSGTTYTVTFTANLAFSHAGSAVTATPTIRKWNRAMARYARAHRILFCDPYAAVVDPTSGGWLSGYSPDGAHPTVAAAQAAATKARSDLSPLIGPAPTKASGAYFLPQDRMLVPNLVLNPLHQDDVNHDGVADSWSTSGTTTYNSTGPVGCATLLANGLTNTGCVLATGTSGANTLSCNAPFPAGSNLSLVDGGSSETVTVKSVAGPTSGATLPWTLTLTTNLAANHTSVGVNDADVVGAVQVLIFYSGTGSLLQSVTVDGVNISANDSLGWSGMIKTYGGATGFGSSPTAANYLHQLVTIGATCAVTPTGTQGGLSGAGTGDLSTWMPFYCDFTVPAGATTLRIQPKVNTPQVALFLAQNGLINETQLIAASSA